MQNKQNTNTLNQWMSNKFGLFIHWGIYSVPAQGEWVRFFNDIKLEDYDKYANQFDPKKFDAEKWADDAWNAGMRYIVFTTKHHDGFCMYDSKHTDFKITNTAYGKDITAELVKAFRNKGFQIGFYHSLVDWRHPHFIPDLEHPDGKYGQTDFPDRDLNIYREYLYAQVEQLLTCYGKIDVLFFDYTSQYKESSEWQAEKLLEMIYKLQPEIIVNDRLSYDKTPVFYGDYCTPEISLPNQALTIDGKLVPWETCMNMNDNWGYHAVDQNWKTAKTIIHALIHCASMGGNLLLNIGPDALGQFPTASIEVLEELGQWIKIFGHTIYGCNSSKFKPPVGCYYTQADEKTLYLHMINPLMGDLILPELDGLVKNITICKDGSEVMMVTTWGKELLLKDELRIRPPKHLSRDMIDVLKIELK